MEPSLWKDLLVVGKRYWKRFLAAFAMVLIGNCLTIFNPLIFRQAVTALDPQGGVKEGVLGKFFHTVLGSYTTSLPIWILMLILVAVCAAFFKYQMRVAFIAISRDVESEVRLLLFEKIQGQSLKFFDQHRIGELMSRLTNDISIYRDVLGPGIMYPAYFITLVAPAMVALFIISPQMAFLSLLPVLILPLLVLLIEKYVYRTSLAVQKTLGEMSTMAHESYSGIRVVKSYAIEQNTLGRFRALCDYFGRINVKLACYEGMFFPFLTFLTRSVTVLLVLLSGAIILRGWGELTTADFVSFMWIQSTIFSPVLMLGWVLPMYIRGRSAYDRLLEIYQAPIEVKDDPQAGDRLPETYDIAFHDLSFSYPETSIPAVSHLNLEIKGGSFVGITGPVGAGKSTLFRLLMREYDVPRGKISIGGRDIHDYKLSTLRHMMVTVEQSPFLFSKTIAENVRFGRPDADQSELELVAHHADLHETIVRFPEQYDTVVGERGVTLSGGQKQRLAIARAFLVDRPILLLDDIFSAVDFETEKRIFRSMKTQFKNKTVLIITHRVSVLEQVDRVIHMVHGKVVEDGTPQELMQQKGYYAALVELQKMQEKKPS